MNTNTMELDLDAMENVSGAKDTETKAAASGLTFATGALTGGIIGASAGPVGFAIGAAIGGAVGGAISAVALLIAD